MFSAIAIGISGIIDDLSYCKEEIWDAVEETGLWEDRTKWKEWMLWKGEVED